MDKGLMGIQVDSWRVVPKAAEISSSRGLYDQSDHNETTAQ